MLYDMLIIRFDMKIPFYTMAKENKNFCENLRHLRETILPFPRYTTPQANPTYPNAPVLFPFKKKFYPF